MATGRRRVCRHAAAWAIAFAALVPAGGPVLAHAPIYLNGGHTTPDAAETLGDPSSPGLVYGTLAPGGVQYLSFSTAADGQYFHAMVLRPPQAGSLSPALAIVGPGLDDASGAPFDVPDGDGVLYVSPPDRQVPIFIADLGLPFIAGAGFNGPLPQTGDYYLVVYSTDGSGGDYTVGTGYGP